MITKLKHLLLGSVMLTFFGGGLMMPCAFAMQHSKTHKMMKIQKIQPQAHSKVSNGSHGSDPHP